MINNPIDIYEHIARLQNWSEQGEVKSWGFEYANVPLIDVGTTEGGFDYEDLAPLKTMRPTRQVLAYNKAYTDTLFRSLCKQFFLVGHQDPTNGKERLSYIADKSLSTPATTITLSDIVGPISKVVFPKAKGVYCEPFIEYGKSYGSNVFEKVIRITNSNADSFKASYVEAPAGVLNGDDAELMWTRGHVLWQNYRQIEKPPDDMTQGEWLAKDSDAVTFLDTWLSYMGALNTDGTPGGVTYEPKKRIGFSVPYETGKAWFLTQHHKLQLPHQTNNQAIEFAIEGISKNIQMGKELVTVEVLLYGDASEVDLYVQDTWVQGALLADWQDTYDLQASHGEGPDTQDIT
jgi:hypothetical protein